MIIAQVKFPMNTLVKLTFEKENQVEKGQVISIYGKYSLILLFCAQKNVIPTKVEMCDIEFTLDPNMALEGRVVNFLFEPVDGR